MSPAEAVADLYFDIAIKEAGRVPEGITRDGESWVTFLCRISGLKGWRIIDPAADRVNTQIRFYFFDCWE